MRLDKDDYQLGKAKVFMRESQKQKLDTTLHQTILSRIIVIQRWYRARHQRHYFVRLRAAVLRIQTQIRCWLATQKLHQLRMQHQAAICIQRMWRGYRVRLWYQSVRSSIVRIQARFRGNQARERFTSRLEEWRTTRKRLREESLSMGSICTQLVNFLSILLAKLHLHLRRLPLPLSRESFRRQNHIRRSPLLLGGERLRVLIKLKNYLLKELFLT